MAQWNSYDLLTCVCFDLGDPWAVWLLYVVVLLRVVLPDYVFMAIVLRVLGWAFAFISVLRCVGACQKFRVLAPLFFCFPATKSAV